ALVSNAEGTQVSWYKRDPRQVREMLAEALSAHVALHRGWSTLSERYREASARITSFDAWERTFAENPAPVRERDRVGHGAGSDAAQAQVQDTAQDPAPAHGGGGSAA